LRSLVIALEQFISFAEEKNIKIAWQFPALIVDLISRRPSVYAEAIDAFTDLRSLAISIIHDEFALYTQYSAEAGHTDMDDTFPLALIRSTSVLLSIWRDEYMHTDQTSTVYVENLVTSLMRTNASGIEDLNGHIAPRSGTKGSPKSNNLVSVELVRTRLYLNFRFLCSDFFFSCYQSGSCLQRQGVTRLQSGRHFQPRPLSCPGYYCVQVCLEHLY